MSQKRAQIGGETGVNGEFYEGGKFLPSTEKPKGKPAKRGSGKQEIEPYKWEVAPEGMSSIYRRLAGIYAKCVNGVMVPAINPQTLEYYGKTESEVMAMIERYNAGERWMRTEE
jgi:hypothetical protein